MNEMKKQISDSIICGIILALSGGSMDAYSYLFRGHVFANAQTGNIILLGVNLAEGDITTALRYLWPVLAFVAGIVLSDIISATRNSINVHWRQISVLIEAALLSIVAFVPGSTDFVANAIISFACGIQVESFRTIRGNSIATTMCIGNLRSGVYNLDKYLFTKENSFLYKSLIYFGVILSFVIGAIIEGKLIQAFGNYAILFSSVLLIIAMMLMFGRTSGENGDTYIEG